MARLRIGSRGSMLALWQAHHITDLLRARGHEVELEIIKTTGDKILDVALAQVGTKGMFTKEIEEALADGRVDLAVHSLKDLPTELPPGFEIVAIMPPETTKDQFHVMLQNLLVERFKLTMHRETKELPMYALVVAKGGPKMTESKEVPPPQDDGDAPPPPRRGAAIPRRSCPAGAAPPPPGQARRRDATAAD